MSAHHFGPPFAVPSALRRALCRCSNLRLCHTSRARTLDLVRNLHIPGVLLCHWELDLPNGCSGGSLPPSGIRLARDDLDSCRFCAELRAELNGLGMPALGSRAVGAGIDPARVRTACRHQASASAGADARQELTDLLVKRAATLDVRRMLGRAVVANEPERPEREVNKSYSL